MKARESISCNVRTTGGVAGREGEATKAGRVSEAGKQVHEAGGSGRTSVEDSDHAAVVAQKLYLASGSMGSPKVSSNNDREKRQEGNRLWRWKKRPETKKKTVGTSDGPKTGGTCCIRC